MATLLGVGLFLICVVAGCILMHVILFVASLPKDPAERADYLRYRYERSIGRRLERRRDKHSRD